MHNSGKNPKDFSIKYVLHKCKLSFVVQNDINFIFFILNFSFKIALQSYPFILLNASGVFP